MILRVPDYYDSFRCTADLCTDSCCIGWEIDIDPSTYAYYQSITGELGERLSTQMYDTKDGEHSFRLGKDGRCPFLNNRNLCELCIHLGEESLSEVCTEYPRFSIYYENVLQKCLSLSCEEVGRILFEHEEPVQIVSYEMPDVQDVCEQADEYEANEYEANECEADAGTLYQAQQQVIALLQERKIPLEARIANALSYSHGVQQWLNDKEMPKQSQRTNTGSNVLFSSYQDFADRMDVFSQMEVLGEEWEQEKLALQTSLTAENYETLRTQYQTSDDYRVDWYEQLLVYFVFRYAMNAVWDYNFYSKMQMAVLFTCMIQDMDILRFAQNHGHFSLADRVDVARMFSKEVEHSEENVALAESSCMGEE